MTMNILIAGNGLDLYHGYKTSYVDFLKYAKEQKWTDNCFMKEFIASVQADGLALENYDDNCQNKKWIDCEEEIKDIINAFIDAIPRQEFDYSNTKYAMIYKYFEDLVSGDYGCFSPFIDNEDRFRKEDLIQCLRKELDEVISLLKRYLIEVEKPSFTIDLFNGKTNFDWGISFNYTDVIKKYIHDDSNILFIHGSLEKDDMVLGTYNIEDKDFTYFEKFFQRIQKRTDYFDRRMIDSVNGVNNHFFGLSFGESDTDLLRELLWVDSLDRKKITVKNTIYYYSQSDYEQKVNNLIKILEKDNFVRWYYERVIEFIDINDTH